MDFNSSNIEYIDSLEKNVKLKISLLKLYEEKEEEGKRKQEVKINLISYNLKRLGIVACVLLFLTSGIVLAQEIINHFNNSNKAINSAIENNYIQKEQSNYYYDKGIGIKINELVLDDLNIDLSYSISLSDKNNEMARIKSFIITTDNKETIYRSEFEPIDKIENAPLYTSISWSNNPTAIDDTTFLDSIIIGLRPEHQEINTLFLDIKSIQIVDNNNNEKIIEGNWSVSIDINDEMKQTSIINYNMIEENIFVNSCTLKLSKTGSILELDSKEKIPTTDQFLLFSIHLKSDSITYSPTWMDCSESKMIIHFDDISSFIEKSNKLELVLDFWNTSIILEKER